MSEWKETAVARRDERQTKMLDIRRPSGSKKDTKRWCRGKVGREHTPKCVSYDEWKNAPKITSATFSKDWKLLVCSECEKQLDYWWPSPWCNAPAPEWIAAAA